MRGSFFLWLSHFSLHILFLPLLNYGSNLVVFPIIHLHLSFLLKGAHCMNEAVVLKRRLDAHR